MRNPGCASHFQIPNNQPSPTLPSCHSLLRASSMVVKSQEPPKIPRSKALAYPLELLVATQCLGKRDSEISTQKRLDCSLFRSVKTPGNNTA